MSSKIIERHQPCPSCSSSDAFCRWDDGHGFCFSCQTNFPAKEAFDPLSDEYTYEYIPLRGINKSTLQQYDVKTKIDKEGKPISLGFPYPNGAYKIRTLDKKDFFWVKNSSGESGVGLFGKDKFSEGSHRYVTITEGELDALSLHQVVGGPIVSVHGAGSAVSDCTVDYGWLSSFERIYLAFDNDPAGRDATRRVAELFGYSKIYVVKLSRRKDANEHLQHGEVDELKKIWWNSKEYLPEDIRSSLDEFEEALTKKPKLGITYPFKCLTDMTYGIRLGECVLLTAEEKVGKTSILHAIEYHLLRETNDNIGAIYFEESTQRHLQSIGGIHLKAPVHLPDCGTSADAVVSAIRTVVGTDDRLYIYSHSGGGDPSRLPETIRFLASVRGCRYFIVDPIGLAVSDLAGEKDERRALDNLCTRLALIAKELDVAIIISSHINDEGKTRGSRWLTKVFDITIQAERNHLAEDPIERNTIRLKIPYNRFCAKSGLAGTLRLNPDTYILEEVFL